MDVALGSAGRTLPLQRGFTYSLLRISRVGTLQK